MPSFPMFQLDAFADRPFAGNPAAYVPLASWLPDETLAAIAAENNLSETAFTVPTEPHEGMPAYHLRWFTPAVEVDLCGHATLATAAHLLGRDHAEASAVAFTTKSGWLISERSNEGGYVLTLPAQMPERIAVADEATAALGLAPIAAWARIDHLYVFDHENDVRSLEPDLAKLAQIDARAVIVTAPADDPSVDFVSRFFAPRVGVNEDPVTGSAHTKLVPYWAARLNRTSLHAKQLSRRGGDLWCELRGEQVRLRGHVVPYLEGSITL